MLTCPEPFHRQKFEGDYMRLLNFSLLIGILLCNACSSSPVCDENQAYNKMLALNKVQTRIVAKGGAAGLSLSMEISKKSADISQLIAQQKFNEACAVAAATEKQYGLDLASEQKDMLTMEQLKKDGGKGSGTCSVADASKKLMYIHGLLQAEVDAGKRSSDIFRQYNDDTASFGELLMKNPSEACALLDSIKEKYHL
jgi:hypothetical protein